VKGGDYKGADLPGRKTVEALGGEVVLVDLLPGHSTTSMVERARAKRQ
jgi:D-beta-D-heptose 7-phosphate kinase/D-beta-D-heptose 1-phosphate adenosyltransferase